VIAPRGRRRAGAVEEAGARTAPAVAVPDVTRGPRRLRLPRHPLRVLAPAVLATVLALGVALWGPGDPYVLAGAAALVGGLALAAWGAARPTLSAVPVVVRQQDSMMDVLVSRELARARRLEASLSLASVSLFSPVDGPRSTGGLAEVANHFAGSLRLTDVIAYRRGASRLTVLLPDTSPEDARALLGRLASHPGVSGRIRVGLASFPHEAVTYRGLGELAASREQPLVVDRGGRARRTSEAPSVA
jgi:hypothetical protein